ncbi:MAG: type 4a pilus biogenesis protein PilO [Armatimonadetes bacterium]|nr:type 4a pilus biogenesis protein PilO [Armatimonadota bacterium]
MAGLSLRASSKGVTMLVIIAVVILFGCVLLYLAVAGKLKSAVSEMETKTKRVEESRQIAEKLEASKLAYLDARSQVRCLETSVSTQEFVPTLMKQLEQLGRSVNLKVLAVRPSLEKKKTPLKRSLSSGKEASEGNLQSASEAKSESPQKSASKSPPYDELKIELELQGRYMDALGFLYKLTSFPKIIAVDEVEMEPPGSRLPTFVSPTLTMRLKVTAFLLKEENKTGKLENTRARILSGPGKVVAGL